VNQAFTEAKKAGSPDEHLMSENVEEDDSASKPGRSIFLVNAVSEIGVFTVRSVGNVAAFKQGGHLVLAGGKKGSVVIGLDVGTEQPGDGEGVSSLVTGIQIGLGTVFGRKPKEGAK
jgi:hypothetical protein